MTVCPYCKTPLKGEAALPEMSQRQDVIYDSLAGAGHKGMSKDDLLRCIYSDDDIPPGGPIVMRVQIHEINKKLKPLHQRIIAKRGFGYVLISTK